MESKSRRESGKPLMDAKEKREIKPIPLDKLFVGELNERIEVGSLEGLVSSIKQSGILVPLLVRPVGEKYEVICGSRRFEAAKAAGQTHAPCQINDMNDIEALQASYAENEQRRSATPVEEGYQCYKLLQRVGEINEVAELLGKAAPWVKNRIEAYELHKLTSAVVSPKGPHGIVMGPGPSGIGLVDATQIQTALRAKTVERALARVPEEQKPAKREKIAKDLVEAIRIADPSKKTKLIAEFKKDPLQDLRVLGEKLAKEPEGLKVSVYFPPESGRFVEEQAADAGLAPSVWVRNIVNAWLKDHGHSIPSAKDLLSEEAGSAQ